MKPKKEFVNPSEEAIRWCWGFNLIFTPLFILSLWQLGAPISVALLFGFLGFFGVILVWALLYTLIYNTD
jgi:hypothetical protein